MGFLILKVNPEVADVGDDQLVIKESQKVTAEHQFPFRIYDGDMLLCFEGVSTCNESFDPLDDFGASYGCTEIHWLQLNGKFEQL